MLVQSMPSLVIRMVLSDRAIAMSHHSCQVRPDRWNLSSDSDRLLPERRGRERTESASRLRRAATFAQEVKQLICCQDASAELRKRGVTRRLLVAVGEAQGVGNSLEVRPSTPSWHCISVLSKFPPRNFEDSRDLCGPDQGKLFLPCSQRGSATDFAK